jgi:hypothetical protein
MKRLALAAAAVLAFASTVSAKTFVIPHVLEKSGLTTNTPFTFDTTLYVVFAAGLGAEPHGSSSREVHGHITLMKFYLFDNDDAAMRSATGEEVCNPCTFEHAADGQRKLSIRVDDLITAKGGFPVSPGGADRPVTGYAVVVVSGQDADSVAMQGFVVNSHTSPFDLSVFGFEPQPIAAAP